MKVDELLKRLENIKIDENIYEKREIAEYLARKLSANGSPSIMTKDKTIYDIFDYKYLLKSNKLSPDDAYVLIVNEYLTGYYSASYSCPLLNRVVPLVNAYLSKLGFETKYYHVIPATGLKYFAVVNHYPNAKHCVVVEVTNIDDAAINTNLPRMVRDISTKQIDDDVVERIASQLISQKLFAGHDFNEAIDIIDRYYIFRNTSLAKEVEAIGDAYNRIFKPYRVIYDLKTKQFIPT